MPLIDFGRFKSMINVLRLLGSVVIFGDIPQNSDSYPKRDSGSRSPRFTLVNVKLRQYEKSAWYSLWASLPGQSHRRQSVKLRKRTKMLLSILRTASSAGSPLNPR